jgi:peptidoglycan/LPS O-acetylase OafA/YrhL
MLPMSSVTTTATGTAVKGRDKYVDFIRAFSLLVVVAWHWVFTIIVWEDDGPHASNPLGFTTGLWVLTWAFQVMPLFFYVGGYGHLRSWEKARDRGQSIWTLVGVRLKRLAVPTFALLGVWIVIGIAVSAVWDWTWTWQAIKLVVSPLWFMGVYLMLVLILPAALWLHERFDTIVLVTLAGIAGLVDVVRFRYDLPAFGLINMIVVWGLCHQLGFFYDRIVSARRTVDWTLLIGGALALAALVSSGLYPGSMVGVPGETSNMAPPTVCIVALVLLQAGMLEIIRPALQPRLERPRWERVNDVINRFALPLFLFHTTGMALYRAINYVIFGNRTDLRRPDLLWWLTRPLAFIGPLLCTLPVIYLFGRKWVTRERPASIVATNVPSPS